MHRELSTLLIGLALIFSVSCSGSTHNPVTPGPVNITGPASQSTPVSSGESTHCWGLWDVTFNDETNEFESRRQK